MGAILIQRCANGFIAAPPDARNTLGAHVFPDTVATDSTQAVAFMQWLDAETRKDPAPPPVQASELEAVADDLGPALL